MKQIATTLSLFALCFTAAFANAPQSSQDFSVLFYNATSRHQGLDQQACVAMQKSFSFKTIGATMKFSPKSNPTYTGHKAIAYYALPNAKALQVDSVITLFKYKGKQYKIPSLISCYVSANPFYGRCVFSNKYCAADYLLVYNSPSKITPPSLLKTVSPN